MRLVLLGLIVLVLGGCFGGSLGMQDMSPEQITALSKIKDAAIACVRGNYAGASITSIYINADKGVPIGGITIDTDCKTTFTGPAGK